MVGTWDPNSLAFRRSLRSVRHMGDEAYYFFERERESSTALTMQKGGENMAISRMFIHIFEGKGRLQEPHTPRFSSVVL